MSGITVTKDKHTILDLPFEKNSGKNLMEFFREYEIPVSAPCGGNGTCGKCMVTVTGSDGISTRVRACQTRITGPLSIDISTAFSGDETIIEKNMEKSDHPSAVKRLGVACDLGTTTVAVKLFDLDTGNALSSCSAWNAQLPYGADVISRAQYTMEHSGGLEKLAGLIRGQIKNLISDMVKTLAPDSDRKIEQLVIAGNTIMQHILAGFSPAPITRSPFIPETLFTEDKIWNFPEFPDTAVRFLPCISGYVGGDITAGLLFADLLPHGEAAGMRVEAESDKESGTIQNSPAGSCTLFLDIGTNGEMALAFWDHLICCSTASGPAFEGASISCGMRSVPGAINHAALNRGHLDLSIIGEKGQKPKGVCGSGLIDLIAILLDKKIVDESGRLMSPSEVSPRVRYFLTEDENENGIFWLDMAHTLSLRQEDIRQIQLAKAAIAAGIHRMMEEAGITCDRIDRVLIAGGFGEHLNAEAVCRIGMIPVALQDKIIAIGNSSLAGAGLLLNLPEKQTDFQALEGHCRYLELSYDSHFADAFVESMDF